MPRPISPLPVLGRGPVYVQNMSFPLGSVHPSVHLGIDRDLTTVEGIHTGDVSEGVVSHLTRVNGTAAPVVTGSRSFVTRSLAWLTRLTDVQYINVPGSILEVEPTNALTGGDQ